MRRGEVQWRKRRESEGQEAMGKKNYSEDEDENESEDEQKKKDYGQSSLPEANALISENNDLLGKELDDYENQEW
nr:neurogenic locus notch homolog protein 2 [Ipomoea batatas]